MNMDHEMLTNREKKLTEKHAEKYMPASLDDSLPILHEACYFVEWQIFSPRTA